MNRTWIPLACALCFGCSKPAPHDEHERHGEPGASASSHEGPHGEIPKQVSLAKEVIAAAQIRSEPGVSELSPTLSASLCFLSALVWNALLILAGRALGENWSHLAELLATYSKAVTAVVLLALAVIIARFLFRRKRSSASASGPS